MKRIAWIAIVGLAMVATPVLAGGEECSGEAKTAAHRCEYDTQACLDYMTAKFRDKGWVGVEGEHNEGGGFTITMVEPDSPALAAGLEPGDVVVALNGIRLSEQNHEALAAAKKKMSAGQTITYTIVRDDAKQDVAVTLGQIPDDVVAKWVGRHLIEEHATVQVANAN